MRENKAYNTKRKITRVNTTNVKRALCVLRKEGWTSIKNYPRF